MQVPISGNVLHTIMMKSRYNGPLVIMDFLTGFQKFIISRHDCTYNNAQYDSQGRKELHLDPEQFSVSAQLPIRSVYVMNFKKKSFKNTN